MHSLDIIPALLREKAQNFNQAADLIEKAEMIEKPRSNPIIARKANGRFSPSGLARIAEKNRSLWAPCPQGCKMRDKKTGEMRAQKHRARGAHIHPHMKIRSISTPRSPAFKKRAA